MNFAAYQHPKTGNFLFVEKEEEGVATYEFDLQGKSFEMEFLEGEDLDWLFIETAQKAQKERGFVFFEQKAKKIEKQIDTFCEAIELDKTYYYHPLVQAFVARFSL